jgi:hypothetical protein
MHKSCTVQSIEDRLHNYSDNTSNIRRNHGGDAESLKLGMSLELKTKLSIYNSPMDVIPEGLCLVIYFTSSASLTLLIDRHAVRNEIRRQS